MRLVAFGILAAMVFGAGCALETGDPGQTAVTSSDLTSTSSPKIRTATTAQPASSSNPTPLANPEPSPWVPVNPTNAGTTPNQNPEPSPWNVGIPLGPATGGGGGDPAAGSQGSGTGSTGSSTAAGATTYTGTGPQVGHWDARSNVVF